MKLKVIFIISIILFVLLFLLFGKIFSCRRLSCVSMDSLSNFIVKDIYQENNKAFRALYNDKDNILRVETITQQNQFVADQYINSDISQIKGLFTDALAPYPGIASNTITCGKEYQPSYSKIVTESKLTVTYFIAYLNNNLTYGSCNESQAVNKGISVYFYCLKDKRAYHFEMIAPRKVFESSINDYVNMVKSIKCN